MANQQRTYKKIKKIIDQYLLENIGEMAVSGIPRFDEKRENWIIPLLCETTRGILPAGKIELDRNLDLIYATPRTDMAHAVEEQLRRLPHLVFAEEGELKAKGIEAIMIN